MVPLLGGRRFQPFPLDVGLGDAVPAKADTLRGGIDLSFAGLSVLETPAIPVEVHLAEKLHALSVPHLDDRENSRVKDLVDVMLLLRDAYRDVARVRASVVATFERRATHPVPERFDLPLTAWAAPYRRFALTLELESPAETVALANEQLHELWAAVQGVDDAMPCTAREAESPTTLSSPSPTTARRLPSTRTRVAESVRTASPCHRVRLVLEREGEGDIDFCADRGGCTEVDGGEDPVAGLAAATAD